MQPKKDQNFAFRLEPVCTGARGFPLASSFNANGFNPDTLRCTGLIAAFVLRGLSCSSGNCHDGKLGGLGTDLVLAGCL